MSDDTAQPLNSEQLRELLGEPADRWVLETSLDVTGDPQTRLEVRRGDDLLGWVEPSDEFPGRLVYKVAVTRNSDGTPRGVPFPAGFMPPDPDKAREQERRRWLPAGHPDRPSDLPRREMPTYGYHDPDDYDV